MPPSRSIAARSTASGASSRRRACWGSWTASGARAARIGSPPTSASGWRSCWRGRVDPPGGAAGGRDRRHDSPRAAARRGAAPGRRESRPCGRLERAPRAERARCAGRPAASRCSGMPSAALARLGRLTEAAPQFVAAEAVRYGGALLALPALLTLGVLEAGEQTYGALKNGLLWLAGDAVGAGLHGAAAHPHPGATAGASAGRTRRAAGIGSRPEVKTLRRKLWELAGPRQATQFSQRLAERWVPRPRRGRGAALRRWPRAALSRDGAHAARRPRDRGAGSACRPPRTSG